MTYSADEDSRDSGTPVELYQFIGSASSYYYTSSDMDVTFDPPVGGGPFDFVSVPSLRSQRGVNPDGDSPEISVTLPISLQIVLDYVFNIAPASLQLYIYRVHVDTGNWVTYWSGDISAWTVNKREASCRAVDSISVRMEDELPQTFFQGLCNNYLYDSVCTISASLYEEVDTVDASGISGDGLTITVVSIGARADQWARGGELVHPTTGDRRMIVDQTGRVIKVLWPFSDISDGDQVRAYAGCDHSLNDCHNKFGSNTANFVGAPYIPTARVLEEE